MEASQPRRDRASQLPFGWVCFSNHLVFYQMFPGSRESQLPFGWVCFSNPTPPTAVPTPTPTGLNCLSAGSVSLTSTAGDTEPVGSASQLPFGWVCFSNGPPGTGKSFLPEARLNCLSAGSVSLTNMKRGAVTKSQSAVSIAFRLGLFL